MTTSKKAAPGGVNAMTTRSNASPTARAKESGKVSAEWQSAASDVRKRWPRHTAQLDRVFADHRSGRLFAEVDESMKKHRPEDNWRDFGIIRSYTSVRETLLDLIARALDPLPPSLDEIRGRRSEAGKCLRIAARKLAAEHGTEVADGVFMGGAPTLKSTLYLHQRRGKTANEEQLEQSESAAAGVALEVLKGCADIDLASLLLTLADRLEKSEPLAPLTDLYGYPEDPALPQRGRRGAEMLAFVHWVSDLMREATGGPKERMVEEMASITFNLQNPGNVGRIIRRFSGKKNKKAPNT